MNFRRHLPCIVALSLFEALLCLALNSKSDSLLLYPPCISPVGKRLGKSNPNLTEIQGALTLQDLKRKYTPSKEETQTSEAEGNELSVYTGSDQMKSNMSMATVLAYATLRVHDWRGKRLRVCDVMNALLYVILRFEPLWTPPNDLVSPSRFGVLGSHKIPYYLALKYLMIVSPNFFKSVISLYSFKEGSSEPANSKSLERNVSAEEFYAFLEELREDNGMSHDKAFFNAVRDLFAITLKEAHARVKEHLPEDDTDLVWNSYIVTYSDCIEKRYIRCDAPNIFGKGTAFCNWCGPPAGYSELIDDIIIGTFENDIRFATCVLCRAKSLVGTDGWNLYHEVVLRIICYAITDYFFYNEHSFKIHLGEIFSNMNALTDFINLTTNDLKSIITIYKDDEIEFSLFGADKSTFCRCNARYRRYNFMGPNCNSCSSNSIINDKEAPSSFTNRGSLVTKAVIAERLVINILKDESPDSIRGVLEKVIKHFSVSYPEVRRNRYVGVLSCVFGIEHFSSTCLFGSGHGINPIGIISDLFSVIGVENMQESIDRFVCAGGDNSTVNGELMAVKDGAHAEGGHCVGFAHAISDGNVNGNNEGANGTASATLSINHDSVEPETLPARRLLVKESGMSDEAGKGGRLGCATAGPTGKVNANIKSDGDAIASEPNYDTDDLDERVRNNDIGIEEENGGNTDDVVNHNYIAGLHDSSPPHVGEICDKKSGERKPNAHKIITKSSGRSVKNKHPSDGSTPMAFVADSTQVSNLSEKDDGLLSKSTVSLVVMVVSFSLLIIVLPSVVYTLVFAYK